MCWNYLETVCQSFENSNISIQLFHIGKGFISGNQKFNNMLLSWNLVFSCAFATRKMNASPGAAKTFLKRNVGGVILAVLQAPTVVHPYRKYETRVLSKVLKPGTQ